MRKWFTVAIFGPVFAVCAYAQSGQARLLAGFEDDSDLYQWKFQSSSVERVREHATQGRHSLRLTLLPGDFPGLSLQRGSPLLQGWHGYDFVRIDVYNPQPEPVNITVRIDDIQSSNYSTRYNAGFSLRPGSNTIELSRHQLLTSDKSRNIDANRLKAFMFFAQKTSKSVTLYLDNVRLETASTETKARGHFVHAYDFGARGSPVWPGFAPVSANDTYDKSRGFGWLSTNRLAAVDNELPDALCRDGVSTTTNSFVVDLPNGTYRVMASETALQPLDPYRGMNRDWWTGRDVWAEEIAEKFPERTIEAIVTNGQFTLTFTNVVLHWLAINLNDLAELRAARKREFYEKYFYLEPYQPPPNPRCITFSLSRGQTATAIFGSASPPSVTLSNIATELRAVRLMERPIGRGVYRIEPTALMPIPNRRHAQQYALTVRIATNTVPGEYRGEVDGIPIAVRVWPFELPSSQDLPITYGWWYSPPTDTAMRDKELRDMAEHGFNSVTMSVPRPVFNPTDSRVSLKTAPEDEFLAACRAASLARNHRLLMSVLRTAQVLAHNLKTPEFSPQFVPPFMTALSQLRNWSSTNNNPVLAYVMDEPREQNLNPWNRNFADTKRFLELYRKAGIPTAVSLMRDVESGKSYLPLLPWMDVVLTHPWDQSRGIITAAREGKPELWIYNGGMNRLSWGFYPWAIGAKGRWEWHYQWWTQAWDPFSRTSESAWSNGTGAVMPSPDGPLSTVAYEHVRAGIDDFRYVFLLEKLIEKDPERGRNARKVLDEFRGRIPRFLEKNKTQLDDATLDGWREQIAELIVELRAAAGQNP